MKNLPFRTFLLLFLTTLNTVQQSPFMAHHIILVWVTCWTHHQKLPHQRPHHQTQTLVQTHQANFIACIDCLFYWLYVLENPGFPGRCQSLRLHTPQMKNNNNNNKLTKLTELAGTPSNKMVCPHCSYTFIFITTACIFYMPNPIVFSWITFTTAYSPLTHCEKGCTYSLNLYDWKLVIHT